MAMAKYSFRLIIKCFECGEPTNIIPNIPYRFVMDNIKIQNAQMMLESSFFWCPLCSIFTIYDHYLEDECVSCPANILMATVIS